MPDERPHPSRAWGHAAFMALFIVATALFLWDTLQESTRLENLIVIGPVAVFVIGLCSWRLIRSLAVSGSADPGPASARLPVSFSDRARVPLFMLLLALYVAGLAYAWFDVATLVFVFLALLVQGERRVVLALAYAAGLAVCVTWGLQQMVSFPFDTLFF